MFAELVADYMSWTPAALDDETGRLEVLSRELDARKLAVRAVAERRQTPALDGHRSTQAYLRATTNQPAHVARAEVRRARLCGEFTDVGEALMAGHIGIGQIDEMARIARNPCAAQHLDREQVAMLLQHGEHLSIRDFGRAVDHWLQWADPDGAWRDQQQSIDARCAHVVSVDDGLSIAASGGDVLTAEALTNIFAHFRQE